VVNKFPSFVKISISFQKTYKSAFLVRLSLLFLWCYTSALGKFLGCMVLGLKGQKCSQIGLLKKETS